MEESPEVIYYELLDLLGEIKITQGPLAVSSTLNRHPLLKSFIIERQKLKLSSLELYLDENKH